MTIKWLRPSLIEDVIEHIVQQYISHWKYLDFLCLTQMSYAHRVELIDFLSHLYNPEALTYQILNIPFAHFLGPIYTLSAGPIQLQLNSFLQHWKKEAYIECSTPVGGWLVLTAKLFRLIFLIYSYIPFLFNNLHQEKNLRKLNISLLSSNSANHFISLKKCIIYMEEWKKYNHHN